MKVSTGIIFGTMRLGALSDDQALQLVENALNKGIRRFHSSTEYDTFSTFSKILPTACRLAGVNLGELKHIVKIAAPHFGNDQFSPEELVSKNNYYRDKLNTNSIDVIQWMIRHDMKDENGRHQILSENKHVIEETVSAMKDDGSIARFGCFPYTDTFRKAVTEFSWCDVLVDYLNPLETDALSTVSKLRDDQSIIAIRPLFPLLDTSTDHSNHWTYETLIQYALKQSKVESLVISMSSMKHTDEIIEAIKQIDQN